MGGGETVDGRSDQDLGLTALAQIPALHDIPAEALRTIEEHIHLLDLDAGDVLVSQGEEADELFVLVDGRLEVVVVGTDGEQTLTRLEPGATVGEIALLAGDRRSATVRAVEPCRVAAVSSEGFRRLLADHPATAEALARQAVERLRETQLVSQVNSLFGTLDAEVLATMLDLVEWMPVRAGTRLFSQGDEGDAAYLVVTGRLRAFRDENGTETEVGEISRGEMVGEIALLEHVTRTASVYAVRDSQLVRFSKVAFDAILNRYPTAALLVAQTVLRRSHRGRAEEGRRLSFIVVPAGPSVDAVAFAEQLIAAFGPSARHVTSATVDRELGLPGISQVEDHDVGSMRLAYWLEELQERERFIVYGLDDDWSAWSRRALRWADHVLVVGDATADPAPAAFERELWSLLEQQRHPKVDLVLLHPADTELPTGTRRWFEGRELASHFHVRRDDAETMARLGRLLAGEATSVVFGGGGARGFAHLGVLVVLEELGIPIDMVGGTSVGAIMAAGPALGLTAEESRQTALDQFKGFYDYTLPSVAVLKGEKIAKKLRARLGELDIADLWLPYFCVSTNLTHAGPRYHDRGPLVDAMRASIAIPGILPPVPSDGDLLVDGGILDNVPVEEMRRRNPTGRVIALDVTPPEGPMAERDYGLSVSGFRAVVDKWRGGAPPGLLATMVRSTLVASAGRRDQAVQDEIADLYLDVDVDDVGLLDFAQAAQVASRAETTVRPALRRWASSTDKAGMSYVRTPASAGTTVENTTGRAKGFGIFLLTLRDLQHRAVRFAAVIAGTAVVLALLFVMTGLVEQFHREPERTVDALGAEAWLLPDGVSGAFTSASTMPVDTADLVEGVDASPLVVARHSITGDSQTDVVVIGFRPGALGQPELKDGSLPTAPDEVVVDDSSGFGPGEEILLGDTTFSVTGNTDGTTMFAGMPLVFMEISDAQELVYRGQPLATTILLGGQPEEIPANFVVRSPDEIVTDGLRPLDGAISSVNLARILLWFVAAMIIGTMIYLSALERRRDVAVLKAVGGSTTQLASSIALQGILTALGAAAIAAVLQLGLVPIFPLEVTVPSEAFWQLPLIAVLVSLVAGAVGLRKAVGTDPALAFAGPGS